jgi:hypothetical protein
MKTSFTPGPWKFPFQQTPETIEVLQVPPERDSVEGKGWISRSIYVANSKGEILADIKAMQTAGWVQDFNQFEGNAKLIVNAPSLITALELIVSMCDAGTGSEAIKQVALLAINKATL